MSISPDANQRRALHTLTKQHAHLQQLRATLEDCAARFPGDDFTTWQIARAGDFLRYAQGSLEAALNRHGIEVRP